MDQIGSTFGSTERSWKGNNHKKLFRNKLFANDAIKIYLGVLKINVEKLRDFKEIFYLLMRDLNNENF